MNADAIRAAARDAEQRRERIDALLSELQRRLDPQLLTRQASKAVRSKGNELAETARTKGNEIAVTARRTAERQPGAVAAGAGAILLLLAWKPAKAVAKKIRTRRAHRPDLVTTRPIVPEDQAQDYGASLNSPLASPHALERLPRTLPH